MDERAVNWRLPEQWSVRRVDGTTVHFDLSQDGDTLSGTARADSPGLGAQGIVSGATIGDEIELTLYWPAGAVHEYRGTFDVSGIASGTASDRAGASGSATWHADTSATHWS